MIALIGTARYETLLRRLLSTKGSEAAPLLSPEVQPVIVVQNDAPELDFLKGTTRFMGQVFDAAVAGQLSHVMLINPPGSNVLAVVERIEGAPTAGVNLCTIGTVIDIALGVAGGLLRPIDSRNATVAGSVAQRTLTQVASNINQMYALTFVAGESHIAIRNPGIVLAPGSGIGMRSGANVAIAANWIWTERALEQSEEL